MWVGSRIRARKGEPTQMCHSARNSPETPAVPASNAETDKTTNTLDKLFELKRKQQELRQLMERQRTHENEWEIKKRNDQQRVLKQRTALAWEDARIVDTSLHRGYCRSFEPTRESTPFVVVDRGSIIQMMMRSEQLMALLQHLAARRTDEGISVPSARDNENHSGRMIDSGEASADDTGSRQIERRSKASPQHRAAWNLNAECGKMLEHLISLHHQAQVLSEMLPDEVRQDNFVGQEQISGMKQDSCCDTLHHQNTRESLEASLRSSRKSLAELEAEKAAVLHGIQGNLEASVSAQALLEQRSLTHRNDLRNLQSQIHEAATEARLSMSHAKELKMQKQNLVGELERVRAESSARIDVIAKQVAEEQKSRETILGNAAEASSPKIPSSFSEDNRRRSGGGDVIVRVNKRNVGRTKSEGSNGTGAENAHMLEETILALKAEVASARGRAEDLRKHNLQLRNNALMWQQAKKPDPMILNVVEGNRTASPTTPICTSAYFSSPSLRGIEVESLSRQIQESGVEGEDLDMPLSASELRRV